MSETNATIKWRFKTNKKRMQGFIYPALPRCPRDCSCAAAVLSSSQCPLNTLARIVFVASVAALNLVVTFSDINIY